MTQFVGEIEENSSNQVSPRYTDELITLPKHLNEMRVLFSKHA
jgi:hypothetical protein